MQHTGGNWVVLDDFDDTRIAGIRDGRPAIIVTGLYDEENEPTISELDANAHLIAAAPALYAALKNLIDRHLIKSTDGDHYDEVLDALNSAEGRD
jgi:hypothetical protein